MNAPGTKYREETQGQAPKLQIIEIKMVKRRNTERRGWVHRGFCWWIMHIDKWVEIWGVIGNVLY